MICSAKSFDRSASESEAAHATVSVLALESAGVDSDRFEDMNVLGHPGKTPDGVVVDYQ